MTQFDIHCRAWTRGIAGGLLLALLVAPVAEARHGWAVAAAGNESHAMTLDQAIAMAEKRHSARVVRAETSEADGRRVYVLRLLSDEGRVWTVKVDAATGQER